MDLQNLLVIGTQSEKAGYVLLLPPLTHLILLLPQVEDYSFVRDVVDTISLLALYNHRIWGMMQKL